MSALNLTRRDLQLLVQSLDHCLQTCQSKAHDPKSGCEDCDAARELNQRLKGALLTSEEEVRR